MRTSLRLLRNFFPIIIGYTVGGYFAAKYQLLLSTPEYAAATRTEPLYETPHVFVDFYISIIFMVSGLLLNLLWIILLAKLKVE